MVECKVEGWVNQSVWLQYAIMQPVHCIKVIKKFFLNHNKSFRWHLGDYEKHIFFPFEGLLEE